MLEHLINLEQRIKDLEARIGWLEEQVNPDMESMEEHFARMNQIEIPVKEPNWRDITW